MVYGVLGLNGFFQFFTYAFILFPPLILFDSMYIVYFPMACPLVCNIGLFFKFSFGCIHLKTNENANGHCVPIFILVE